MLRVGIVGAGLIGTKRAQALLSDDRLVAVADTNINRAKELAEKYSALSTTSWESLITRGDIEAIIVATTNNAIPPIANAALKAGKHVLVEKPAGRSPTDVKDLVATAKKEKAVLCVGFNHRFHPALKKAKALLSEEKFGPLMYIRARYGHGGRLGPSHRAGHGCCHGQQLHRGFLHAPVCNVMHHGRALHILSPPQIGERFSVVGVIGQ